MELIHRKNGIEIADFGDINLPLTLDCGQAFRWERIDDNCFYGIAFSKEAIIKKTENGILFIDGNEDDINNIWIKYFDLETDHQKIKERLSGDNFIRSAFEKYGTIRILNQEPFETLCSFIISSCNNIPRIKGIIDRLCIAYGEKTGKGYSFPDAKTLAVKTEEDLAFLRAGYRVPYLLDAAGKVATMEIDLEKIKTLREEDARKELMKIKGVGKKVADCTLLFSLGFTDCYPVDRHIERATREFYPDGLPECFHPDSGLAQQYIFSYMLDNKQNKK